MTKIVDNYHDIIDHEDHEAIQEILADLRVVDLVLDKITCGLSCLPETQQKIIEAKYFKNYTWGLTSDAARLSEGQCKLLKRQAIERMLKVTRIKWSDYTKINELISGEG